LKYHLARHMRNIGDSQTIKRLVRLMSGNVNKPRSFIKQVSKVLGHSQDQAQIELFDKLNKVCDSHEKQFMRRYLEVIRYRAWM